MLFISDKKMLEVILHLKSSRRIRFYKQAYEVMNLDAMRINKIKNPQPDNYSYHFTAEQIRLLCKEYGIDANYIYGFTSRMYLKTENSL